MLSSRKLQIGLIIAAALFLLAAGADVVSPYDPLSQDYKAVLAGPSPAHPLGTDSLGRDNLARLAHGARVSLAVAVAATALMIVVGLPLGAAAGYFGGLPDSVIMRVADVFLAFPFALGAIALMAVVGPGSGNVLIALALFGWPQIARVTRAQVMNEAAKDYVAAVKVAGGSAWYIIRRHLLPNAVGPVAVFSLTGLSTALLTEATLSFLGIGIQLPHPAWGSMLADAVGRLTVAPWLIFGPGAAVVLACLGFNLLGEGLHESLDVDG
ncbi:MAG: ABC transporter permease [Actinomycetota bacterium]|nr:ABC transporter permease [Actinomycetota bacterium]